MPRQTFSLKRSSGNTPTGPAVPSASSPRPKPREVFAADFRDRVVHHLLVSHQERIFEPRFIHDSYACRKGKGSLAASARRMVFLRKITANGKRPAWALKLMWLELFSLPYIKKHYSKYFRGELLIQNCSGFLGFFLFHHPTTNYRFRSRRKDVGAPWTFEVTRYLRTKASLASRNERGLPIGNLTSRVSANVYLNEFLPLHQAHS